MTGYNPYTIKFNEWFNSPDDPLMKYKKPIIDQAIRKQQEKMAVPAKPIEEKTKPQTPGTGIPDDEEKSIELLKQEIAKPIPKPTSLGDVVSSFTSGSNILDNIIKGLGKGAEYVGTSQGQGILGKLSRDPYDRLGHFTSGGTIHKEETASRVKAEEQKAAFTKQLADIYDKQREAARKSKEDRLKEDADMKKQIQGQGFTHGENELNRENARYVADKSLEFRDLLNQQRVERDAARDAARDKREDRLAQGQKTSNTINLASKYEADTNSKATDNIFSYFQGVNDMYNTYKNEPTNQKTATFLDQSLGIMFNKMQDKNSAVLQQEYARTYKGQPLGDYIQGQLAKVTQGGPGLSPEIRDELYGIIKGLISAQLKDQDDRREKYKEIASEDPDLNPELIVGRKKYFESPDTFESQGLKNGDRVMIGQDLYRFYKTKEAAKKAKIPKGTQVIIDG